VIDSTAVLSYAGSVFRAVTLALFAASLLVALPMAVSHAGKRIVHTVALFGEDVETTRRRLAGPEWVDAIEEIRRTIPRNGDYLLVNAGGPRQGGHLWVRYELAPRRVRFLGLLSDLESDPVKAAAGVPPGRWVVIAYPDNEPPVLLGRDEFLRRLGEDLGSL
jgi:hypothetical protein